MMARTGGNMIALVMDMIIVTITITTITNVTMSMLTRGPATWKPRYGTKLVDTHGSHKVASPKGKQDAYDFSYLILCQVSACDMVHELALELQESFSPYVERVTLSLSRLLETSRHEDVVSYCLVAMPQLIRAICKSTQPERQHVSQITAFVIQQLIQVIR